MTSVVYTGSGNDPSGYGDANRADITALFVSGVNVYTQVVAQTLATTSYGWQQELCKHLERNGDAAKIKIIHLTPDCYPRYIETGKYHIGRLAWETDKLPAEWVDPCNEMQEIWTMTEGQAKIIKDSGVTVPIHVFPEPLDITNEDGDVEPWSVPGFSGTIFYSIFQWIERKDPWSLLTAYWKTFEGKDDVVLILKTYRVAYTDGDFEKIKEDIKRWKLQLKLKHYPKVFLIKELWPQDKLWKLHKLEGTFVSASHGEGWCRPAVEASLVGNPVIAIDKTGFADAYPKDHFYPIKCKPSPVVPQSWIAWYQKGMNWLDIDTKELGEALMNIYKNPEEGRDVGEKSQKFVKDNFNYWTVGQAMKTRLAEIERLL